MKLTKIISCILSTAVLMLLIPGCGSKNSSYHVTELPVPGDDLLFSVLNEPDASLMLCNNGTYEYHTPYMDDNLQLLYWEYIMTEEYFNTVKADNIELAATATAPESGPDVPLVTVPDYDEYDDVSFREYRKEIYEETKNEYYRKNDNL